MIQVYSLGGDGALQYCRLHEFFFTGYDVVASLLTQTGSFGSFLPRPSPFLKGETSQLLETSSAFMHFFRSFCENSASRTWRLVSHVVHINYCDMNITLSCTEPELHLPNLIAATVVIPGSETLAPFM